MHKFIITNHDFKPTPYSGSYDETTIFAVRWGGPDMERRSASRFPSIFHVFGGVEGF